MSPVAAVRPNVNSRKSREPKPGGNNPKFETEMEFRMKASEARRKWYQNKKAKVVQS